MMQFDCSFYKATSLDYFTNFNNQFLFNFYRSVQDIDLVTGALSEAPISDSVLGPTFLCLLGRTFRNIRLGKYSLGF